MDLDRDPVTGKRQQKWYTVQGNRKTAERFLADLISDLERGTYIEPSDMNIAEYLEYWLQTYAKSSVSERTFIGYEANVRRHIIPYIGRRPLSDLKPVHVQELYSRLLASGLSPKTVHYIHTILHQALKHAVKWELIVRNVTEATEPPKVPRYKIQVLDAQQAARLLHDLRDARLYMPVLLALTTGMRRGEILGLTWPDIDFPHSTIHISRTTLGVKGGAPVWGPPKTDDGRRTVALPAMTVEALQEHQRGQAILRHVHGADYQSHDLVICLENGRAWDLSNFSNEFRRTMDDLGFKGVRFHDLRHTHATLLLTAGTHPKIVSERLGHATVHMTLDTYSHVLPQMQKEAAGRIDDLFQNKGG